MVRIIFILLLINFSIINALGQEAGVGLEYPIVVKRHIDSLESILEKTETDTTQIILLNLISRQYRVIDEYQSFIKALEALEKAEKIGYWHGVAESYMNLGFINNEQGLYDQAIEMYQKGLEVGKKHNIIKAQTYCLNGIGIIYWERQDYKQSLYFFEENKKIQEKLNLEKELGVTYNNIGLINNHLFQYEEALKYLFKAKAIREKYKESERNIATLNNIGISYLGKKQYKEALENSLQSLKLAKTYYQKRRIKEATITLAEIYEGMGDYQNAYRYLQDHKIMLDSIAKQDKASIIAEINRKKDIEQKESQISILRQNNQLRNIIYGIITLVLIGVIGAILWRAKRKQQFYKVLLQKNDEISNQKGIIEQQNAELLALNDNLEKIVEERTKKLFESNLKLQNVNNELDTYVYRFAHDFRSPLSTMMGLSNLGKMESQKDFIKEIFDKVDLTLEQMDSLLRKLSGLYQVAHQDIVYTTFLLPSLCEKIIKQLSEKLHVRTTDIQYSYQGDEEIQGDKALIEIALENIIENAIVFSSIKPIQIKIEVFVERTGTNHIRITDQGIGIKLHYQTRVFEMFFRGDETSKGNGLGLHVVQKAIDKMQGEILLESEPNQFTAIELILPINNKG
ncbi:hypothetical protein AD998_04000 [bacterium 336/3]|nr:hypothetical protein AD998_04000 [bacterium 336/3]